MIYLGTGGVMDSRGDRYLVIQEWMITELGLRGNDLIVYAIIWGFSQDGKQVFSGSLGYLSKWTGASKRGVIKNIQSLLSKGLLLKVGVNSNNVVFYRAIHPGGEQSSLVNKVHGGGEQSSPNNIIDNIDRYSNTVTLNVNSKTKLKKENNKRKKESAGELEAEFELVWAKYPRKEGKGGALAAYKRARKAGVNRESIESGIEAYKQIIKMRGTEYRYIKVGSTWFNQKCWEDDYETGKAETAKTGDAYLDVLLSGRLEEK